MVKLAVRYRKYFPQCKLIPCSGRPGKGYCPGDRPKRSNGEYKACGTWCIEFFDDNKEWQSLTFKDVRNKTEAEKRFALFISDRERGKLDLPKKKAIPTLAEYSSTYLELYKGAKESTLATRKSLVASLLRYLGSYKLDVISQFIVEKFRIEYRESGVMDGTVNDCVTTLSHIFNTAIKDGVIDKNPCEGIKRFKVMQTRDRVFTTNEIALLLDSLQWKDRLMTLVSVLTGMRLNEVLKLRWRDIDFTRGLIIFVQSKTGKLMSIPISGYLAGELQKHKETCSDDGLFESKPITKKVASMASNRLARLFKQILKDGKVSFHTLRHTFTSIQGDLGAGANTIRELLGHSSLSMTTRYSHSGMDAKTKAIETLTEHILNNKVETATSKIGTA